MASEGAVASFRQAVCDVDPKLLYPGAIETLQVNVGNLCNQSCVHCHVSASPNGQNNMSQTVFEKLLSVLRSHSIKVLDITGGAPEMNLHFRHFVEQALPLVDKVMVRTNLTVFFEPTMSDLPQWYAQRAIALVASLPCYSQANVDRQRGDGVFDKSIRALQQLNQVGYGQQLDLHLVYNPSSDVLPPNQAVLEQDYKHKLEQDFGIVFTGLYTLANLPVGRFKHFLRKEKKLDAYVRLLADHFNPKAVAQVMCRSLISIDWQGRLYHCDFNQQEQLPIRSCEGEVMTLDTIDQVLQNPKEIITGHHCYGCTAGAGSSCQGALS